MILLLKIHEENETIEFEHKTFVGAVALLFEYLSRVYSPDRWQLFETFEALHALTDPNGELEDEFRSFDFSCPESAFTLTVLDCTE